MQFYETNLGNRFFNGQLPALINALKDIAQALNRQDIPAVNLPADISLSPEYLKEFFYGNLEPSEGLYTDTVRQMAKAVMEIQDKLRERLSAEDWELVMELNTLVNNRSSEECAVGFQIGFSTAMQMVTAGLSGTGITGMSRAKNEAGGGLNERI